MKYFLAMERTDGTMDKPYDSYSNKATAMHVARCVSKKPSFDCVRLWVEDAEGNGLARFDLPKWEA